jgi:hypothetical protein
VHRSAFSWKGNGSGVPEAEDDTFWRDILGEWP